jgi:hypothetical protein
MMNVQRRTALLALLPLGFGAHAQAQWSPPQLPDVVL